MAATKKSAKRKAAKKGSATKRQSARKKSAKKSSSNRAGKKSTAPRAARLKRQARKGLKAARGGIDTVLQAGGKTWKTLKSTTSQVVEGMKGTLGGDR